MVYSFCLLKYKICDSIYMVYGGRTMNDISIYDLIVKNTQNGEIFKDSVLMEFIRRNGRKREEDISELIEKLGALGVNTKDIKALNKIECGTLEGDYIRKIRHKEASPKLLFATKNIASTLKEDTFQKHMELLEKTFEDEDIKVIYNYEKIKDDFLKLDDELVFSFFNYVASNTQDIETLKYALVMVEGRDISKNEEVLEKIKNIGLCVEFTYYCMKILKVLYNSTEEQLNMLNKMESKNYNLTPALMELDIQNKEVVQYIITNAHVEMFRRDQKYLDMLVGRMNDESITEEELKRLMNVMSDLLLVRMNQEGQDVLVKTYLDIIVKHQELLIDALSSITRMHQLISLGVQRTDVVMYQKALEYIESFIKNVDIREKIIEYLHDDELKNDRYLQEFVAKFDFKRELVYLYSEYKGNPVKYHNLYHTLYKSKMFKEDLLQIFFDYIEIEKYENLEEVPKDLIDNLEDFSCMFIRDMESGEKFANKMISCKSEELVLIGTDLYSFWKDISHGGIEIDSKIKELVKKYIDSPNYQLSKTSKNILGIKEEKDIDVPENLKVIKDNTRNILSWNYRYDGSVDSDTAAFGLEYLLEGFIEKYEQTDDEIKTVVKDMVNDNRHTVQIKINSKYDILDQNCSCGKENCEHIIATVLKARREINNKK